MAKPPRRPREIKRSAETQDAVVSPLQFRRRDPRQAELFTTSFVEPCKPTLRAKAPSGDRWQFEIKHDGYRAQCHVNAGRVRIYTKSGLDWTDRFPAIRATLEALPVEDAVIDGEAVMMGPDGITDFFALHAAVTAKSAPDAFLYAFDLLHLDGHDLRPMMLTERRALLEGLVADAKPGLTFSEHVEEDGPRVAGAACELGLEGVVAKLRDAPYRSGRSDAWLKIKCARTDAFLVVGFAPDGRTGVRSLELADERADGLAPAGSVGSGLTAESSRLIRKLIDAGGRVVVQVEHRGRTPSGGLRHPVLKSFGAA